MPTCSRLPHGVCARVNAVVRFTHIAVDHVTLTRGVSPVIFVTSLEGHVFKYAQLASGGGTAQACLVEVLDLGCDGSGRTTPRSILLDDKQVNSSAQLNRVALTQVIH